MNAPTLVPTTTLGEPATMIGQRTPKQSLFLPRGGGPARLRLGDKQLGRRPAAEVAPQQRAWLLSHLVTDMQSAGRYTSSASPRR